MAFVQRCHWRTTPRSAKRKTVIVFADHSNMNYFRAAYNWGQAAGRAVIYGSLGCAAGWAPGSRPFTQWCMYRWCKGSANGLRIKRTLINADKLDQTGQAIIVCNHQSSLDILVLGGYLRRDYRWLAKASLFKVPFSGWYLRFAGHIPVHREHDPDVRKIQIQDGIEAAVSEGASILIFPEGPRSDNGQLQTFRMGAFIAAQKLGLPILPLVIRGTHELMEKGAPDLSIRPDRECSVTVLDPIYPTATSQDQMRAQAAQLRDTCFAAMATELAQSHGVVNT